MSKEGSDQPVYPQTDQGFFYRPSELFDILDYNET